MITPMLPISPATATSSRRDQREIFAQRYHHAPIALIGVATSIVAFMRTSIWICWASSVVR